MGDFEGMNQEKYISPIEPVDKKLYEKLMAKYENFTFDGTEFNLGPIKVQIDLKIAKALDISEEEIKNVVKDLCIQFFKVCYDNKIHLKQKNISIFVDPDIDRGLSADMMVDDNTIWGIVWIPTLHLKPYYLFCYTFLHEIGHCWLTFRYESLAVHEYFVDVVAAVSLSRIVPFHSRIYKDILKLVSYFHREKKELRLLLQNPDLYLRNILDKLDQKES